MSTNIVVNLVKGIASFVRKNYENSVTSRVFSKIGTFFKAFWSLLTASVFFRVACSIADAVSSAYKNSGIHRLLTSKAVEEKRTETSVFYRVYSKIIIAVMNFCSAIILFLKKSMTTSVIFSRFVNNADSTELSENKKSSFYLGFFGFVIGAMFCVPHSFWNNIYGLAISFLVFAWVIYGYATNKKNVHVRPDRTYLSLIMFFAALTFSLVVSKAVGDSIRIYIFFVTSILLCTAISMFVANKDSFRKICFMLFLCVVVTGLAGVIQAALKIEADASLTDLTLNADMPGRVFATMGNPNNFAQMLVLFMPFAMAFVLTAKGVGKKILLCLCMLIPFVALLQTYSRSGWIAFAVAVMVFVALANRRAVPFLFFICIIAIPLLPQSVLNRILTIGNLEDSSSSFRLVIWEGALKMLSEVWVTGVGIGPGAFKEVYPIFAMGNTRDAAHCHMQFLEVFLETGILGFTSFLWMTFTVIKRSFIASSSKNNDVKYFGAAAAASMTSIIFIGFFEYYWFYPRVMFAFFISTGLAIAAYRIWQDERSEKNSDAE